MKLSGQPQVQSRIVLSGKIGQVEVDAYSRDRIFISHPRRPHMSTDSPRVSALRAGFELALPAMSSLSPLGWQRQIRT